jgi:hypothetical protein
VFSRKRVKNFEKENLLMALTDINRSGKGRCACCGYYRLKEVGETCPVSFWEENICQEENFHDNDAPNYISLGDARENFKRFSAKRQNLIYKKPKPRREVVKYLDCCY